MTATAEQMSIVNPLVMEYINRFKQIVWEETKCPADYCESTIRTSNRVFARQLLSYTIKFFYPDMSTSVIGSIAGRKDHATFLHSIKSIENYLATDKSKKELIDIVLTKCNNIIGEKIIKRVSKIEMAEKVVNAFLSTGKPYIEDTDGYGMCIDGYLWNDDSTIAKLQSNLMDKGILSKYKFIDFKKYIVFNFENFV